MNLLKSTGSAIQLYSPVNNDMYHAIYTGDGRIGFWTIYRNGERVAARVGRSDMLAYIAQDERWRTRSKAGREVERDFASQEIL